MNANVTSFDRTAKKGGPHKLARVDYKLAGNRREWQSAFSLVQHAYREAGLSDQPAANGMRVTPWHLLPTTDVFIASYENQVIYTMTLISDDFMGMPMESIYVDEIANLRAARTYMAEVSCLASHCDSFSRNEMFQVFVNLVGLMFQYARQNEIDRLVIAVHPRHGRFYQRFLGFEKFGEEKSYKSVCNRPAVAFSHDFRALDQTGYKLLDQVYEHRYTRLELLRRPMLEGDREYFSMSVVEKQAAEVPVAV